MDGRTPQLRNRLEPRFWILLSISFVLLAAILSGALIEFDAFERFYAYTRDHEDWELDEIAMAMAATLLAFVVVTSIAAFVVMRRLITEVHNSMELERQLAHGRKLEAVGTLIFGVAHSVNNFLVPILTLSKLTRKSADTDSVLYRDMDKVVQAVEGASAVLRDVLVFTRWAENDEKSCQIEDALRSTLPLARVAAPSTVHVRDNIDPTPGTVDVSFTDLQTIVLNFTSNGTAAIGANVGEIIVGLRTEILTSALTLGVMELKPGNYAVLSVSDSGAGMDGETLRRAIEPFFTTKEVGQGTGLGLSMAHGIVTSAGGGIDIESDVGSGTVVRVYLPLRDGPDTD